MREESSRDPSAFHGGVAAQEIHWFDPALRAWLALDPEGIWHGFDAVTGERRRRDLPASYRPWARAFDDAYA